MTTPARKKRANRKVRIAHRNDKLTTPARQRRASRKVRTRTEREEVNSGPNLGRDTGERTCLAVKGKCARAPRKVLRCADKIIHLLQGRMFRPDEMTLPETEIKNLRARAALASGKPMAALCFCAVAIAGVAELVILDRCGGGIGGLAVFAVGSIATGFALAAVLLGVFAKRFYFLRLGEKENLTPPLLQPMLWDLLFEKHILHPIEQKSAARNTRADTV